MTIHAAGTFQGRIVSTSFEQDSNETDGLVLLFEVELEDGHNVTCKHRTHGPYSHICKGIIKALGLEWPKGVLDINTLVGQTIPIKIKHKPGKTGGVFENAYVDLGSGNAPADADFVKQAVAKMVGDDDIPF